MQKTKKMLLGIAKCGSRVFTDAAEPYNENARKEQDVTLRQSLRKKIEEAGLSEMKDAFSFDSEVVDD